MLRMIVVGLLAVGLVGGTARADALEQVTPADRDAIRAVIEAQINAFRVDDGATAFAFASPAIQTRFGDPATFMDMVRTGYAPVYRPQSVRFLDLVDIRGEPTQPVLVTGPDDRLVTAYYIMQKQPDGTWRIDGCILQRPPDESA